MKEVFTYRQIERRGRLVEQIQNLARLAFVVICIGLLAVSLFGGVLDPPTNLSRFVLHIIIFCLVTAMALVGWKTQSLIVLCLLILLALSHELVQIVQAQRNFRSGDMLGNLLGVFMGYVLFVAIRQTYRQTVS